MAEHMCSIKTFHFGKSVQLTSGKKCTELDGANTEWRLRLLYFDPLNYDPTETRDII